MENKMGNEIVELCARKVFANKLLGMLNQGVKISRHAYDTHSNCFECNGKIGNWYWCDECTIRGNYLEDESLSLQSRTDFKEEFPRECFFDEPKKQESLGRCIWINSCETTECEDCKKEVVF